MNWQATDFETAATLGALLAKEYGRAMFELLVTYQDVAASEAASRLNLHIRTAQDYLDALVVLGIVAKTEVHEGKRPYFRYVLEEREIAVQLDLGDLVRRQPGDDLARCIRERAGSGADFIPARGANLISSVSFLTGDGADGATPDRGARRRKQRRLHLTTPQGAFLFHLPFPDADPLPVSEIMRQAGVDAGLAPEILDLVSVLAEAGAVEGGGRGRSETCPYG